MNHPGPPPESRRCRSCCWSDNWKVDSKANLWGQCRFNPPGHHVRQRFPKVNEFDWCRQHAHERGWLEPKEE